MNLTSWRLLLASLPSANTALRMRLWRAVRGAGAAVLRDGAWFLPDAAAKAFDEVVDEVVAAGGSAEILAIAVLDEVQEARFRALFDRTADFARLIEEAANLRAQLAGADGNARQVSRLRREVRQLSAIDFFPGEGQAAAKAAVLDLERLLSPHEPGPAPGEVPRLDCADYQGLIWATRARPWVDRLASAWLIGRFIDRQARFVWLETPAACPSQALGFDFDGAAFSHVGERVTFETLLASFGLAADPGLSRLARIVHYLDVGGLPAPEAAGLEALLAGMRAAIADDDKLLEAASGAFDFLYTSLKESP